GLGPPAPAPDAPPRRPSSPRRRPGPPTTTHPRRPTPADAPLPSRSWLALLRDDDPTGRDRRAPCYPPPAPHPMEIPVGIRISAAGTPGRSGSTRRTAEGAVAAPIRSGYLRWALVSMTG